MSTALSVFWRAFSQFLSQKAMNCLALLVSQQRRQVPSRAKPLSAVFCRWRKALPAPEFFATICFSCRKNASCLASASPAYSSLHCRFLQRSLCKIDTFDFLWLAQACLQLAHALASSVNLRLSLLLSGLSEWWNWQCKRAVSPAIATILNAPKSFDEPTHVSNLRLLIAYS